MEVHAHTHTARKKWTHYLWEFLMLFLAVFCGFLAENFREKQVEHHREKEYIRSMIADLKKDTAGLNNLMKKNRHQLAQYDSLRSQLKVPSSSLDISRLYYLFQATAYYYYFTSSQGTIQQLENAGGLRLIRNQQARDSITKYYNLLKESESQVSTFLRYFDQFHELTLKVFDMAQIDTVFFDPEKILQLPNRYTLLTRDDYTLKLLNNKLFTLILNQNIYKKFLERLFMCAANTIQFLQKEYSIK